MKHPFPSSSLRSQDNFKRPVAGGADAAVTAIAAVTVIPKGIPRGIPRQVAGSGDSSAEEAVQDEEGNQQAQGLVAFQDYDGLGGNLPQPEGASEGFLNIAGEDEDNLAIQQQLEEEEVKTTSEILREHQHILCTVWICSHELAWHLIDFVKYTFLAVVH